MINKTIAAFRQMWSVNRFAAIVYAANLPFKLLGVKRGYYFIRGQWYVFHDSGIATLVIYKEIILGNYNAKLKPAARVLDIGAHVGMFSIPLSRENPSATFLCVEPDSKNYANLCRNIKKSGATNIIPIQAAVGIWGYVDSIHDNFNSGASHTVPGYGIPSRPLQSFGPCDLLKIDVEGAEYDFISTPKDWDFALEMIIEIHAHENRQEMIDSCKGARILLTE